VEETGLARMISYAIRSRKESLDAKAQNGKKVLDEIRVDLMRLAFMSHSFAITLLCVKLSLSINLLNNFFEERLQRLVTQKIRSEKYDISASIKEMLRRELAALDVSKHFDPDYVLLFARLKEDLSTYKSLEATDESLKTTALSKVTNVIFDVVSTCSSEIIEEIDGKVSLFLDETIQTLEKEPSLARLEKHLDVFIARLHKELYGWPLGEK
jgi:BMFP domain-containing protein YqiC